MILLPNRLIWMSSSPKSGRCCAEHMILPQRKPPATHRGATLDAGQSVLLYQDQKLELTKNECRILLTLMEHKGTIVGRDTLMQRLWDSDCFIDDNTLTVNVARLRKKLDEFGLTDFIATRKGQGYMIADP